MRSEMAQNEFKSSGSSDSFLRCTVTPSCFCECGRKLFCKDVFLRGNGARIDSSQTLSTRLSVVVFTTTLDLL